LHRLHWLIHWVEMRLPAGSVKSYRTLRPWILPSGAPIMTDFADLRRLPRMLCLLLCLQLGACAALHPSALDDWPEGIPPASYFVAAYEADPDAARLQTLDEYLYWVRGFYAGTTFYPRGWNDVSEDLLADMEIADGNSEDYARRERTLYELGRDIAAEWAKDGSINRVDNQHLATWAIAASRAVKEENVDETLERISEDVQALLALQIGPDEIDADRYHEPDPDDWFGH
jgi:hypothetical protein